MKSDEYYMKLALRYAKKAEQCGEVPIGALIVCDKGTIIGRGYNCVERLHNVQEHAELRALRQATKKQGDWRLYNTTIYITLEPCPMCFNAIFLSRCSRIVFGASSPLFGFHLDKNLTSLVYTKHIKSIEGGVCSQESQVLLKRFFKQKRGEDDVKGNKCG